MRFSIFGKRKIHLTFKKNKDLGQVGGFYHEKTCLQKKEE